MDKYAIILEKIKWRGYILKLKWEQLELEQRYKDSVSDEEWQEYLRRKKRISHEIKNRYNAEHRDKDDYIQDPKTGKMMGRKSSDKTLTEGGDSDKIPVRDCSKIKQLTDIDNTAARKLVKGFDGAILDEHWDGASAHKDQYTGFTKEQYAQRARELLEMPTSKRTRGYVIKSQNIIVRYDTVTNDYVKGHIHNGIITMFKPKSKAAYYENKRKQEKD